MSVGDVWSAPLMVVEDDPLVGELVMLRLESAGYRASWVKDGGMALNRIGEIKPTLMLLDLGLPVIDGFQVLQTLRAHALWRKLPIIVLTARHNAEDVRRALALGASDYMVKPFEAPALIKRIERQLMATSTVPATARKWD